MKKKKERIVVKEYLNKIHKEEVIVKIIKELMITNQENKMLYNKDS